MRATVPPRSPGRSATPGSSSRRSPTSCPRIPTTLRRQAEEARGASPTAVAEAVGAPSRKVRNGIILAMLGSLVIVLLFCGRITTSWGNTRMNREADAYENQVSEWLAQQKSLLYMFTDVISSRPELMEDYDSAVRWLNDVARHYPEISGCSQEDSGNTTRYGGSGLGMAITKSIVEMMGGEIGVESEKGLGTTFTVSVRLDRVQDAPLPEAAVEETPDAELSLEGKHVLIAEDQPMNAEILTDLLELEDISSEWAQNGRLAVELFAQSEEGHFDAILMDMRMPVMDGLSATEEIRKLDRPDARTIPIVALTANAFEEDVKQCLQAGMDAHLSKPVDIETLKETLRRLLAARN